MLVPTGRLPFQTETLEALCAMIAKGLTFHHFGVIIPADHHVTAGALTAAGEALFGDRLLAMNGNRVRESVGDGAFEYDGLQSAQDQHVTVWRLRLYGGVRLGGDPNAPHEDARHLWVTTSKSPVFAELRAREPA
jgi:hypothetical protein